MADTRLIDITGQRFGRLVVVCRSELKSKDGSNSSRKRHWECKCDCGKACRVAARGLRCGRVKSCGCLRRDATGKRFSKHGQSRTPEYRAWRGMKARCTNPNGHKFKDYGGRGIAICERWQHSFEGFLADMGPRPSSEHSLDRIDNNGNYEPGNCRWATRLQQMQNQRRAARGHYGTISSA